MTCRAFLILLCFGPLAACASDTVYTTTFAPDFERVRHTVSVLGVYKDGRMSSEAWDAIEATVSPSLGAAKCDAAYAEAAASPNRPLWDAIDDYTRNDGPTDALIAKIAPAALGDLVMVITVAGRLPAPEKMHGSDETPKPSTMGSSMGRGGGLNSMRGSSTTLRTEPSSQPSSDVLDLQASLFSVSQGKSVALVGVQYSGRSMDEAITRFSGRLRQSLPATSCVGWNWDTKIDPDTIRQSIGQAQ
jgi:hypothetical protein